jgi:serine-type D-Ala-D-Ala carboxypeptidase/endopeptidase (penicillin-binding protein 4)
VFYPEMSRLDAHRRLGRAAAAVLVAGLIAASACLAPAAQAAEQATTASDARLLSLLGRAFGGAGGGSGAYVFNLTERHPLFSRRSGTPRVLASNTKLFTTAAALRRYGAEGRLRTRVLGSGQLDPDGTWQGDLYLRGGGDPTFGSRGFALRSYGTGASVQTLAARIEAKGIQRVDGAIVGDESRHDTLRGGPGSGFGISIYVGPLSALSFDRNLSSGGFLRRPALTAARRLKSALQRRGIAVADVSRTGRMPAGSTPITSQGSPTLATLARLTNKSSDNFFAELLVKELGVVPGRRHGTTRRGARAVRAAALRLGSRARIVDGSGLSRGDRAAPRQVVRLLTGMRGQPESGAYSRSLAVAGRDGTLGGRMRSGPANGRCRGKTGTISGVSALSGYCRTRSGDLLAFSFLMNGVNISRARRIQDRMAHILAGSRG